MQPVKEIKMESSQMAKQMIVFQKTAFNNGFNTLAVMQNQTEAMMTTLVDQFPWVTEDGKKQMTESFAFAKKTGEEFKKTIDDGYTRFEALFD
jgi:hypothetical protein